MCPQVQGADCDGYSTDTFLLCVMFARLSELRSVLHGLIPELILSQKCNTLDVHMGPIFSGYWFRNSWSVAAHFTRDGVDNTRNSHLWDSDNPNGTVESNYQHLFALNLWCGVINDHLISPYVLPQRLTGDIYANFLQMNYQHSSRMFFYKHVSCATSMTERRLISVRSSGSIWINRFPNRRTGRRGTQKWPSRSPDLNPLDYHVWDYMKAMVYEHKLNTRK